MMPIRVLHLGNTNNIGYEVACGLREIGVEADLLVDKTDFLTSNPQWEHEDLDSHDWIRYYRNVDRHAVRIGGLRMRFPYFHRLEQFRDMMDMVRRYDIVQAYNYDVILCLGQFKKPYVAFCIGGDLNITAFKKNLVGLLLRWAYRRARYVLYSNINMIESVKKLKLANALFMPLPINTEKYKPCSESALRRELDSEIVLFSPTRHDWEVKGNEKLLHAFAQLVRQSRRSVKLILCSWGRDLDRSRTLCSTLGIEDHILWQPLMPKNELLKFYQAADIIIDQFNLGAFGLVTLEAMSCAKPVILNYDKDFAQACYSEMPPLWYAADSHEIVHGLTELLENQHKRIELGAKSREWVLKYHDRKRVAYKHLQIYRAILNSDL